MAGPRDLIVTLNSLRLGDLDVLRGRILSVRERLQTMGQPDLSERLEEALRALERGETTEYRRLVNQVVSRLGHLPAP
jgi:cobalamin biosynthesis protein CobD/CbiB